MAQVIEGQFRRVSKRKKKADKTLDGLGVTKMPIVNGDGTTTDFYPSGDSYVRLTIPSDISTDTSIPLATQAWEYLNQDKVQAESVAINGTNNPHAMDNNVFYSMEQDARQGVDAAVTAAQKALNTGFNWIVIGGIVLLFVLPMLNRDR